MPNGIDARFGGQSGKVAADGNAVRKRQLNQGVEDVSCLRFDRVHSSNLGFIALRDGSNFTVPHPFNHHPIASTIATPTNTQPHQGICQRLRERRGESDSSLGAMLKQANIMLLRLILTLLYWLAEFFDLNLLPS
jgi:hypothetical protein